MKRRLQIIIPLLTFAVVFALLNYVLYIGYVPTESMEPTIPSGSIIIGLRIHKKLAIGDTIIFEHENIKMVKRIFACPGDVLSNGSTIPSNHYYVVGDNILNSYDSRHWRNSFIDEREIIALYLINF